MKAIKILFILMLLFTPPAVLQAEFTFTTNNGTLTIWRYTGTNSGDVTIPDSTNGYPVTRIGDSAFEDFTSLTSITIGNSVTDIGDGAFQNCTGLTQVTIGNSLTNI